MRVYISCHHPNPANELAAALTAAGHVVVSTWHTDGETREPVGNAGWWRKRADYNFALIETADVLALVAGPERYPGGKFVEAGYAMKEGLRVVTVGTVENGMMQYGESVPDVAALVRLLGV